MKNFPKKTNINASFYMVPPYINPDGLPGDLPGGEEPQFWQPGRRGKKKDLLVQGSLSEDGTQYTLEFHPLTPDSGILLSDQLLYESPQTGYQSSVQLTLPRGAKQKKYLYINLENGKFYGRLETKIEIGSAQYNDSENQICGFTVRFSISESGDSYDTAKHPQACGLKVPPEYPVSCTGFLSCTWHYYTNKVRTSSNKKSKF